MFSRHEIKSAHEQATRRNPGVETSDSRDCILCHRTYLNPCDGKDASCPNKTVADAKKTANILSCVEPPKPVTPIIESFLKCCFDNSTDAERDQIIDAVFRWAEKRDLYPSWLKRYLTPADCRNTGSAPGQLNPTKDEPSPPVDEKLARWRAMLERDYR